MAITRTKKEALVTEVNHKLQSSKLTVVAEYLGTPVKSLQELRALAKESNTSVKVFKNRLVLKALDSDEKFKNIDRSTLRGMLLYAFSPEDELASAQVLAKFAKSHPTLKIIGSINEQGEYLSSEDTMTLANLPSKEQLRGQLVGVFAAPLTGFAGVLSANIRSVLNVLNARSESLS